MLRKQSGGEPSGILTSKKTGHNRYTGVGGFEPLRLPCLGDGNVVVDVHRRAGNSVLRIYAFLVLTGARTRWVTRHSERTADSMYDNYGDPARAQRRSATGTAASDKSGTTKQPNSTAWAHAQRQR
jgi:hypothetical protein